MQEVKNSDKMSDKMSHLRWLCHLCDVIECEVTLPVKELKVWSLVNIHPPQQDMTRLVCLGLFGGPSLSSDSRPARHPLVQTPNPSLKNTHSSKLPHPSRPPPLKVPSPLRSTPLRGPPRSSRPTPLEVPAPQEAFSQAKPGSVHYLTSFEVHSVRPVVQ